MPEGENLCWCLRCSFHAAWRGRHPVRADYLYLVCLLFLTLGKLSPVLGEQDDQCRLPYQLGQAAGGTTPKPSSSPCLQSLELLPERHLLSSFFSHSGFSPSLTRARKEEIIHFGACVASVAWWLCPRALGGMPARGMRCHPAAVTSLCPTDLLCS